MKKNTGWQTTNVFFIRMVYITGLMIAVESCTKFINGKTGQMFFLLNLGLNTLRICMTGLAAYFWLSYTIHYLYPKKTLPFPVTILTTIPCIAIICMTCTSPWTGWIVYTDRLTNVYSHGKFFFIQKIVTYGYFTVAGFISTYGFLFAKDERIKGRYLTVTSLIFFPAISGILQAIFPSTMITWQATIFALFFIFSEQQFAQISIDALTGINNRNRFNNYMRTLAAEKTALMSYLFMLDVNYFKEINDRFGHPEGDAALEQTAQLIKAVFCKKTSFIARYGGDEFAVVLQCDKESAKLLKDELNNTFDKYNEISGKKYKLTLSIGYAPYMQCKTKSESIKNFIAEADKSLYEDKQKIHSEAKKHSTVSERA